MHDCPNCGQACYCSGDIDDISVYTEAWVIENCRHECDELDDDDNHPDEVDEYYFSTGEPNPKYQIHMETMIGVQDGLEFEGMKQIGAIYDEDE